MKFKEGGVMDIQKEKEAYLGELLERDVITQDEFRDLVFKPEINVFDSNYLSSRFIDKINFGWSAWQAKAKAVPEGFVLVEREKLAMIFETATNALDYYTALPKHDALSIIQGIARNAMIEAQEPK